MSVSAYAPIDTLPDLPLGIIFYFATDGGKDKQAICRIREVHSRWYAVLNAELLGPLWKTLQERVHHPNIDTIMNRFVFAEHFVNQVIHSALSHFASESGPSDEPAPFSQIQAIATHYFSRFASLSYELTKAPGILGFDAESYSKAQQELDASLVAMKPSLWRQISKEIPTTAQDIRLWLNNPANEILLSSITRINLQYTHLNRLAPEIGRLPALTWLDLPSNNFTKLPETIGNLTQLKELVLSHNRHLKSLPPTIHSLICLSKLDLSENPSSSIPKTISHFAKLTALHLRSNQLTTLPQGIDHLPELTQLILSDNSLSRLPETIGNLPLLTTLELHKNRLTSLPEEIGNLIQLTELDLSRNQLTGLPKTFINLSQLAKLSLENNSLTTFPEQIGSLTLLTQLHLASTNLSSFPEAITHLVQLKGLYLNNNQLTSLPETICNLSELQFLHIHNNCFTKLPETIGYCPNLKILCFQNNHLSSLPETIGHLRLLHGLYLQHNRLTSLPRPIINLPFLSQLKLQDNPFICILDKNLQENERNGQFGDTLFQIQSFYEHYLACSDYPCRSALASFCQEIHRGSEDDVLQTAFEKLSAEMQQQIRRIWTSAPSSSSSSSEIQEDLFADRSNLAKTLIRTLQDKWAALSNEQHRLVYAQVSILAGLAKKDANWGEAHAKENIIRLIDALKLG